MFIFVAVLALIGSASAQVELPGQCGDPIKPMEGFDISRYMGVWYQIYRVAQPFEAKLDCVHVNYTLVNSTVNLVNSGVFNHTSESVNGTAMAANATVANFVVTINNNTGSYWVTATDYDSYAVVYSCKNLTDNKKSVTPWLISRTPHLSFDNTNFALEELKKLQVGPKQYQTTNHTAEACHSSASLQQVSLLIIAISALLAKFL